MGGRCPALVRGPIFDIADVRFERRQPTHVDQAIIPAAINISGGVFAAVAGDNLADQLEVFVVHVGHFLAFSPSSTSRRIGSRFSRPIPEANSCPA